jgi:hypothetical protein
VPALVLESTENCDGASDENRGFVKNGNAIASQNTVVSVSIMKLRVDSDFLSREGNNSLKYSSPDEKLKSLKPC